MPTGYVSDKTDCNDSNASANPGESEVCDGVDNDCDGVTDEDEAGGGICGPCNNGTYVCLNGVMQCSGGDVPTPEVCDGVDNNCDGQVDEGVFQICGGGPVGHENDGICQQGTQACDPASHAGA